MGFFSKGLKHEFETAVVNEPSVFVPLKFYCNTNVLLSDISAFLYLISPASLLQKHLRGETIDGLISSSRSYGRHPPGSVVADLRLEMPTYYIASADGPHPATSIPMSRERRHAKSSQERDVRYSKKMQQPKIIQFLPFENKIPARI